MLFWFTLGVAVSVIAIFETSRYLRKSKRPLNFPPGPPTIPVLGNLHQVPLSKSFLKFQEWTKTYGSVIGLKFGSQNVVVLNDYQDVRELFDKKGSIYSSRANSYIPREIVCPNNIHILFIPHGNDFRRLRTAMALMLSPNTVQNLLPIQNAESAQLMYHLLQEPENFNEHIQRWGVAIILASVYGQRGMRHDSGMVKEFFEVQRAWAGLLEPGATPPVDIFPILGHLPESLASWKRTAKFIRNKHLKLYFEMLDKVKRRMKERTDFECLLAKVLRDQGEMGFTDEQIAYLGGFLMEAGSDTTSSTMLSFLLALAAYPEIQKRVQEEVDGVCGVESPPSHHDIGRLSYLKACYMEVLRWRPTLPSGVPHVLDSDDTYKSYYIPKDTLIIANTWAIHHNNEEFDSPSTFNPDRWLRNHYGIKTTTEPVYDDQQLFKEDSDQSTPQRRTTYAFGSGRRICPGDRMAENGILLAMSKLLWAFDIVPKEKLDVSVEDGFSAGLAIAPRPFKVGFVVRDEGRRRGLMDDFEKSEGFLSQFEE